MLRRVLMCVPARQLASRRLGLAPLHAPFSASTASSAAASASASADTSMQAQVQVLRQQLSVFPEYAAAQEHMQAGAFAMAVPPMQRVGQVLASTMGSSSALAGLVTRETATALQLLGRYEEAGSLLHSYRTHAQGSGDQVGEYVFVCSLLVCSV